MNRHLRLWVPPIVPALFRRLRPVPPMLSGAQESAEGLVDEAPFATESWSRMSQGKLEALGSRRRPGAFLPPDDLAVSQIITSFAVNLASREGPCRVLDFGGGTGLIYFQVHPYLVSPSRVSWHVVDAPHLADMARAHLRPEHDLHFEAKLPESGSFDVVHVNTALQYVMDYAPLFDRLLSFDARYIVLTRLVAGEVATWFTSQRLHGKRVPFVVIGIDELLEIAGKRGYELVLKAPSSEDLLGAAQYANDIPADRRLPFGIHLVLSRTS